ncbi:MAG: hypothetical protein V7K67_21700 [Nostoc sp.]
MSIVETAIYRVSCLNRTVLGVARPTQWLPNASGGLGWGNALSDGKPEN